MTHMIELVDKDVRSVTVIVILVFKKLGKDGAY